MKILAFVDLHCDMKALEKIRVRVKKKRVDLILCAGDISLFSTCLEEAMKLLNGLHRPVLMVHGNHETEEDMVKLCNKFENIQFIHEHTAEIRGVIIMGYGGGGFSTKDRGFEKISSVFAKKMKGKKSVLLTHAPPYGTKLDKINGDYAGNKSIAEFIKKNQPDVVICGHLHETAGKTDKIGKSWLVNPGWNGVVFEL